MSVGLLERPVDSVPSGSGDGGLPARRAVTRWAWRLFRREWRQQALVLALIVVAVAATFVGSAVATNQPQPKNFGFGTAKDSLTYNGNDQHLASQIALVQRYFGTTQVIENQYLAVPGSVSSYDLRAMDPHGAYGGPMLQLVSGHYPNSAGQVAMTATLASAFNLRVGGVWHEGGRARTLVGIVQNPQSLLDEFALVTPGQVQSPDQVIVLFDANDSALKSIGNSLGARVETPASVASNNILNPETISLAVLTIGMVLIALMSIGGFTVLAQRRMRSLGMLASLGATDRNVSLVVRANGVVVGFVGAVVGTALGFVLWLAYRPHLEQSSHHLIGLFALPWTVIVAAMVLAVVATYFAASRPAHAVAKVPVVAALSGRPAPPRQIHRSAIPGLVLLGLAFLLLGYAGGTNNGNGSSGMPELMLGLVLLIPGVILLSPFFLSALARLGRRTPIAVRLALRDLARYRARSGSALAAISIGVLIAVVIALVAAARYGNVLDYAGPNVASNQIIVWPPGQGPSPTSNGSSGSEQTLTRDANAIGAALGAQHVITLETANAGIAAVDTNGGRQWDGAIFVATPQLLNDFGISASQIQANADFLTSRPGLSGSGLAMLYQPPSPSKSQIINPGGGGGPGQGGPFGGNLTDQNCTASNYCLLNPVIQDVSALPSGTSGPNTVVTEYALNHYHLQSSVSTAGWLVQSAQPITAAQIKNAESIAAADGMSIESKNDQPTSAEVINWATVFGIAVALGILAMSVGLIRSETANDLRTLAATGASSYTRRTITAATAGGLALLGAVLGTLAGYVGVIGFLRSNSLNGGIASLGNVPVHQLLFILIGMPLIATLVGWVLAGRDPAGVARQPME
ncbi:MAG TPA: FtsX-like permease family protein [Acidimicrobiales bacterium]|nr:FtsX-like permease family protein [Acidimicrobiales bacterium]